MPFTFSTEAFTKPLADFGNDAAQMILQTGAVIQDGLQKMMTNRQVAGLGAELGQLNPESPEWAQQAVQLGSRYPLAMKSPAGQFMLHTQATAHAQWMQAKKAAQSADLITRRQIGMENLRTKNDIELENVRQKNRIALADERGTGGVDLLNGAQPVQRTPASGINLQSPTQSGAPLITPDGSEVLTSGTNNAVDENIPLPMEDPLTGRALSPLRTAQQATGVKPTRAQVFSAISQEDRQMQQEKRDAERTAKSEADALAKKEETLRKEARTLALQKENAARTTKRTLLMQKRKEVGTAVSRARAALNKHLDPEKEREANDNDYFAKKAALQGELQRAGEEAQLLDKEITSLVDATDEEDLAKPAPAAEGLPVLKFNPKTRQFQ